MHEDIIKRLEKAKLYLLQTAKLCKDSGEKDLGQEAESLVRLVGLLKMNIDSVGRSMEHKARMAEHDKRIAHLGKEIGELAKSINDGENRIASILQEGKAMSKLDPMSDNFREELAKINFDNPIIDEAVKAFAEGDDEKAFKSIESFFKPKH